MVSHMLIIIIAHSETFIHLINNTSMRMIIVYHICILNSTMCINIIAVVYVIINNAHLNRLIRNYFENEISSKTIIQQSVKTAWEYIQLKRKNIKLNTQRTKWHHRSTRNVTLTITTRTVAWGTQWHVISSNDFKIFM